MKWLMLVVTCVSLALFGGLLSFDARWFGVREYIHGLPRDYRDLAEPLFHFNLVAILPIVLLYWLVRGLRALRDAVRRVNVIEVEAPRAVPSPAQRAAELQEGLRRLVEDDPHFSGIAFLDFTYALWSEVVSRTLEGSMELLGPYFSEDAARQIQADRGYGELRLRTGRVAVHGLRVDAVREGSVPEPGDGALPVFEVDVVMRCSFGVRFPDGTSTRIQQKIRLTFARARGVLSRPPQEMLVVRCQTCGGDLARKSIGEACPYCGQTVTPITFNWTCRRYSCQSREEAPEPDRVFTAPRNEDSLRAPSKVKPDLDRERLLRREGPAFLEELAGRAHELVRGLDEAWRRCDPEVLRPLFTERLLGQYRVHFEEQEDDGGRAGRADWRLEHLELVWEGQDRFFQWVSLRVHLSCLEFKIRSDDGAAVSGSREHPRRYSEYWTLVRRLDTPEDRTAPRCGQCGSQVESADPGFCGHCGSRLFTQAARWELSLIEDVDHFHEGESVRGPALRLWPIEAGGGAALKEEA